MRFKRRNVLYAPGVEPVHDSTYAPSSARQRHSRGPPPPRWCPHQEASCTSPSATTKTGQGTHLSRGSMSFTNALRPAAHCGPSDMECTLTFPYHQEFLKKSSGEQSYDHFSVFLDDFSRFSRFFTIFHDLSRCFRGAAWQMKARGTSPAAAGGPWSCWSSASSLSPTWGSVSPLMHLKISRWRRPKSSKFHDEDALNVNFSDEDALMLKILR